MAADTATGLLNVSCYTQVRLLKSGKTEDRIISVPISYFLLLAERKLMTSHQGRTPAGVATDRPEAHVGELGGRVRSPSGVHFGGVTNDSDNSLLSYANCRRSRFWVSRMADLPALATPSIRS